MKVILTENVKTLGSVGEIVNVSQGYARNFLIPNQFAMLADEGSKRQMKDYQKRLAAKVAQAKADAEAKASKLSGITVNLIKKIGGNGRLFGTVTNTEVAAELAKQGIDIERRLINVDTPIKTLGEFELSAKLFKDVNATFKVKVEIDPKQAEELKKKQEAAAAKKKARAEKAAQQDVQDQEEAQEEVQE